MNFLLSNLELNVYMMNEFSSFDNSFKKSLTYSLKESLLSCSINMMSCYSSDFIWHFDPKYGNFYSFNTGFNSSGN